MLTVRRRTFLEWVAWDAADVTFNTAAMTLMIALWDKIGWLAYVGIGSPSWGQCALVAFVWASLPSRRASRYEFRE